ncbi:hypothetical protein EON79_17780, partial [bacterium]
MNNEIQACVNLLREIAEIANHASLTGSLAGGERRAAARYNSTLNRLLELGAVGPGLFEPLPDDSNYGEIGIEARMLASSVDKPKEEFRPDMGHDPGILLRLAPFVDRKDLADMVRDQLRQAGSIDMETIAHLGPFLDREVIGDLLRGRFGPKPPNPPAPPVPPVPPVPAPAATPVAGRGSDPEQEPAFNAAEVIAKLKNPSLSPEER